MTDTKKIDLSGRVALITGAGRGLGLAYAQALAERGAKVIVQDSGVDSSGAGGDPAVATDAAQRIRDGGGDAQAAPDPIADRTQCAALVKRIIAEHDAIDILIHNAGWVGYQPIEELEPAFLDRMMQPSVHTALWLAQAVWPGMRARKFGRIVLTTSDRAIYPQYAQVGLAAYAAAKLAVVGIVNILALEGRDHGIMVNAISPVAKTRMWGVEDEPDELKPSQVAAGVAYLSSPVCTQSGWVLRAANGQFVATKMLEAEGVAYPRDLAAASADSPEAFAAAWPRIAVAAPERRGD